MTERELQHYVAAMLDRLGLVWCHPPNEGWRSRWSAGDAKRAGMKAGVPDVLVFSRHPDASVRGVAIELKVGKGKPTAPQLDWHQRLADCGWDVRVCYGVSAVLCALAPLLTEEQQRREWLVAAMEGVT